MTTNQIVAGFSLTNRWLLYANMMLAPAQAVSGWGSNCPSNIGFLAYNWYTQIQWFQAIQAKQLHAVSMLPVHYNTLCSLSYLGGITSGNFIMGTLLGLGTVGVMILNNVSGWVSWATNQTQGFGEYQFFFFGWRTLSPGWHKFFLVWQISDSLETFTFAITAMYGAIACVIAERQYREKGKTLPWWARYPATPIGAAFMLFLCWPLILWFELIISSNNIDSPTDWIAVWLFIAQVVAMLLPNCGL
jgi:hypothetical protein